MGFWFSGVTRNWGGGSEGFRGSGFVEAKLELHHGGTIVRRLGFRVQVSEAPKGGMKVGRTKDPII